MTALLCAASLFVYFRDSITSGVELVTGNGGDNRLYIVILEHWVAVLRGQVPVRSPIFFWPEPGVLGYTDTFLLFVPPYAVARTLGFDRYAAFQGTVMSAKALGFVATYLLLRRALAVDRLMAALGAVLFTISNASYLAAGHAQFFTLAFVPLVALLVCEAARHRRHARHRRARLALMTCALLLALIFYTSFYTAWFTVFVGGLAGAVAMAMAAARNGLRLDVGRLRRAAGSIVLEAALVAGVFGLALVPFLAIYVPILGRRGGRSFAEVAAYLPEARHVLNVGPGNLVWGSLLAPLATSGARGNDFSGYELQRGWPPGLLALFATTAIWLAIRPAPPGEDRRTRLVLLLAITTVLAWILSLHLGGWSLWRLVHALIPGASAIRVPVRINHVLNVAVIAVAVAGLDRLWRWSAAVAPRAGGAVIALLAVGLTTEQLNTTRIAEIDRARERAVFGRIGPAPPECRQFYAMRRGTSGILPTAEAQIDAMLVAYERGIPTLNGWSGNVPAGWDLNMFDDGTPERAMRWAVTKGVAGGLCALDLATGAWTKVDGPPDRPR